MGLKKKCDGICLRFVLSFRITCYSKIVNSTGVGVVDGVLYAVGGHDGPLVRNSVEMYNPETNTWSQLADMHSCRRNAGTVLKGLVYVL